jgi:hypothetical protein
MRRGKAEADMNTITAQSGWERVARAVEQVRDRLPRATAALEAAGVPYAVAGGHAVACWVEKADDGGVRNTPDVDILIRRNDREAARQALETAGFVSSQATAMDVFLDGPRAKARDAVHVIFAREKVRPEYDEPTPDVAESEPAAGFRVLNLDALVRMKLTSNRDKDRTHIRDLIDVGLIDASWVARVPPVLAPRLQSILDTPDG